MVVRKNEIVVNAEIREVKCRKLVCLDKEVTVKFNTNDIQLLRLGVVPSDATVELRVRW